MTKTRGLIEGLRRNQEWANQHNIRPDDLAELESVMEEGERLNAEAEALRAKMHLVVTAANLKLRAVREKTQAWKREVKRDVSVERWPDFGVPDKR